MANKDWVGWHGVYEIINKAHVVVERKSRNRFFLHIFGKINCARIIIFFSFLVLLCIEFVELCLCIGVPLCC